MFKVNVAIIDVARTSRSVTCSSEVGRSSTTMHAAAETVAMSYRLGEYELEVKHSHHLGGRGGGGGVGDHVHG